MKRRDFLGVIGGAALAWPFETHGQTATQWPDRPVRLLYANRDADSTIFRSELDALVEALARAQSFFGI